MKHNANGTIQFDHAQEFLQWKSSPEGRRRISTDKDRFLDFYFLDRGPHTRIYTKVYIQDARYEIRDINQDGYKDHVLTMLLAFYVPGKSTRDIELKEYRKTCIAPVGTDIDFSVLTCPYTYDGSERDNPKT